MRKPFFDQDTKEKPGSLILVYSIEQFYFR